MVSAVTDKAAEKLRMGIMLRDIGFIACSDEIAHKDDTDPNLNEHTIRGLEIISGLNDELVDAVARYHHSTLKSKDCPTDLSSDILRCVFCNFDFWVFTTYYFRVSRFPARAHGQFP